MTFKIVQWLWYKKEKSEKMHDEQNERNSEK